MSEDIFYVLMQKEKEQLEASNKYTHNYFILWEMSFIQHNTMPK